MQTRRELAKALLCAPLATAWAANAAAKTINSKIDGVMIGAQSYSFRDRPLDAAIQACVDCGLGYCELWQGHLEPQGQAEAKKWRLSAPSSFFRGVRQKFDNAGVKLVAWNYSFRDDYSDAEINRGFRMAQWMGLNKITASSNVDMAKRISPYADKFKVYVGFHNHASMAPNEFSTPKDFEEALKGNSKYLRINLDIGHATAAGWDPVDYLAEHHDKVLTLHLKDRSPNSNGKEGENLPWGEGTTKISAVLLLLKEKGWPIPANIEYEYGRPGMNTIAEVKKCYDYCKKVLA
jgi:sugar phosphate isomerase/epimerase